MNQRRLVPMAIAAIVLAAAVPAVASDDADMAARTMKFGMNRASAQAQIDLGIKPDYAQFWAGAWNGNFGGFADSADKLADQGITPVVEWWYWGDDISVSCIKDGCQSKLHKVWKSRAKWKDSATLLAKALHSGLKGRPGIVVVESEFNKNGIGKWETFDGYLAEHAKIFRQHAPEVKLILGFGNWGSSDWANFDRAVAAMDGVGFQTMRGSTRESLDKYLGTVDAVKSAASKLKGIFGKPVLLHDLALSTYPSSSYEKHQETVVKEVFARLDELKSAGVYGIVYRAMKDNADANRNNYYGEAERHFGLRRADWSAKPALNDWVGGVKAERGGSSSPSPEPSPSEFTATFTPKGTTNNWWVEVKVTANEPVAKVDARVDGGSWRALAKKSWGAWAASFHVKDGQKVQFRATSQDGDTALSSSYTWG